jgi:serine/threonine-protein kinase RsbW
MDTPVSQTFPALPSALYEVRKFVREQAEQAGLSPSTVNDVVLAVSEACANAVLHSGSTEMEVEWRLVGECVEATVTDRGTFVRRVPIPEFDRTSGHGIPLMMALMDEVGVKEGSKRTPGTTVRLVKCRER